MFEVSEMVEPIPFLTETELRTSLNIPKGTFLTLTTFVVLLKNKDSQGLNAISY